MTAWVDVGAVLQIAGFGLLVGAGLPSLYALGIRLLGSRPASGAPAAAPGPARRAAAVVCFAVVAGAVVTGLLFLLLQS
ncbi:hypothetical protein [Nakamurella endophytica]|uniref:Uncharacterized protein n=1 Tax=Nakamurella endophytica TaxID=1748367 RepID=A0A917T928_9ACTN|nr:hypothetical protein [Nakamurella endophytica]GGM14124.1 hypothetical protein GCM10011594_37680 [Nakamurella endophytica]